MNFLSHYYFERYTLSSEQVLGGLLPDLLKNVDKKYTFQLHKYQNLFSLDSKSDSLKEGWKRHLEVDKLFHSSDFFYHHTHALRKQIEMDIADLPIRSSFLAHISLELLLDHKLIANNLLSVSRLYEHLEHIDRYAVTKCLKSFEIVDIERFYNFYDKFVASRYIFDYAKVENLPHALFNICKRVWDFTPHNYHFEVLSNHLESYQKNNLKDYGEIFLDIAQRLD